MGDLDGMVSKAASKTCVLTFSFNCHRLCRVLAKREKTFPPRNPLRAHLQEKTLETTQRIHFSRILRSMCFL